VNDNVIQAKIKQQEINEEGEHKNLFTQFGLILTYSGKESSSLFHYSDEFLLGKDIGLQELLFKPNSTHVSISSCDQEAQS